MFAVGRVVNRGLYSQLLCLLPCRVGSCSNRFCTCARGEGRACARTYQWYVYVRVCSFNQGLSRNTHNLPALVSAVAECQTQFPAMIKSVRPWTMCLDSTPYI